jgi:hypothetical protein
MNKKKIHTGGPDKKLAAVCGLFCEACTLFIATMEDPDRLKGIAERFKLSEEALKCYGCRSDKRGPYCEICHMAPCASKRGIDFCVECDEFPCNELKQFQSERPHRIELWNDQERIGAVGFERWMKEARENYSCEECRTINSAYDLKCRTCGNEPSCRYVSNHKDAIIKHLENN